LFFHIIALSLIKTSQPGQYIRQSIKISIPHKYKVYATLPADRQAWLELTQFVDSTASWDALYA